MINDEALYDLRCAAMPHHAPLPAGMAALIAACRPSLGTKAMGRLEEYLDQAEAMYDALGDDDFIEDLPLTSELFLINFYRNIKRVMAALDEGKAPS